MWLWIARRGDCICEWVQDTCSQFDRNAFSLATYSDTVKHQESQKSLPIASCLLHKSINTVMCTGLRLPCHMY